MCRCDCSWVYERCLMLNETRLKAGIVPPSLTPLGSPSGRTYSGVRPKSRLTSNGVSKNRPYIRMRHSPCTMWTTDHSVSISIKTLSTHAMFAVLKAYRCAAYICDVIKRLSRQSSASNWQHERRDEWDDSSIRTVRAAAAAWKLFITVIWWRRSGTDTPLTSNQQLVYR